MRRGDSGCPANRWSRMRPARVRPSALPWGSRAAMWRSISSFRSSGLRRSPRMRLRQTWVAVVSSSAHVVEGNEKAAPAMVGDKALQRGSVADLGLDDLDGHALGRNAVFLSEFDEGVGFGGRAAQAGHVHIDEQNQVGI